MNKKRWIQWLGIAALVWALHGLTLILCYFLISDQPSFSGVGNLIRDRLTLPGDAVRYLDIAKNGYVKTGENAINLVFYPLYPFSMRLLGAITGDLAAAGLMISRLSYAGAAVFLFELLRMDRSQEDALYGVLLMALYPFSFFAMGVYTEGLFLLCSLACLYALRNKQFVFAGIAGFLAALTRTQGMLLVFPGVYEVVTGAIREKRRVRLRESAVLLIPLGFAVYASINYALHGNPFQFLQFEAGEPWFQTSQWLGRNIALQMELARSYEGLDWIIYYVQILLYFLSLAVLFYGIKNRERVGEMLYGGVYLGFTFLSGWMISGGRYMLSCVPLFIALTGIKNRRVKALILVASAFFSLGYSLLFYMGHSIM